jgi:CheY-like chemotaxis protein
VSAPSPDSPPLRILVADDEPVSLKRLTSVLEAWGHTVVSVANGAEAWDAYQAGELELIVTDWIMPEVDGIELCKRVRQAEEGSSDYTYIIMLTGKEQGLVEGMSAGADDFVTKPFVPAELRARLQAGRRLLDLKRSLDLRVEELQAALSRLHRLEGLLPICSYCKNIRDEDDAWQSVERYVSTRSDAHFSHSICPSCYQEKVIPQLEEEGM